MEYAGMLGAVRPHLGNGVVCDVLELTEDKKCHEGDTGDSDL